MGVTQMVGDSQVQYMCRMWKGPDVAMCTIGQTRKKFELAAASDTPVEEEPFSEWGPKEAMPVHFGYVTEQDWPNYPRLRNGNLTYLDREYIRVPEQELETPT